MRRALAVGAGVLFLWLTGAGAAWSTTQTSVPAALDVDSTLLCTFDTGELPEVSGLALSRRHTDVVWATNDSLNGAYLYALSTSDCRILARLRLRDAPARDHEALASGTDARGRPVVWIGDIGNNDAEWPDVRIQKVVEPRRLRDAEVTVTTYRFTYPRGPVNAEALIAAPDREQLWVITKEAGDGGEVYRLPIPLEATPEPLRAVRVGAARRFVTDAAMAPDGRHFVVRDYVSAEVFAGEPPGQALARFRLPLQFGGEAVTWTADGHSLLVAAERSSKLIRVAVPRVALGEDTGIAAALPRLGGFDVYPYVRLAVAGVAAVSLLAWGARWSRRRRRAGRREPLVVQSQ